MFIGISLSLTARLLLGGAYTVAGFDPPLVFDFVNEYYRTGGSVSTFADSITHSRASTATYVDADGILQTAGINVPRLGHHVYDGTEWVNEGLLHESEARTNLALYSAEFDNAYWGKSQVTVVQNAAVAPDGTTTAEKIVDSATIAPHDIRKGFSVISGTAYTISFYAKAGERTEVMIGGYPSPTQAFKFNLATGTLIGAPPAWSPPTVRSISPAGNGWYRCSITITATATTTQTFFVGPSLPDDDNLYLGDGTSGLFIYGAQLEVGSTPSSYIPTAGATVTRAADTLTVPAANLPWPSPVVIGPELVTNGTFDTDTTGWTTNSGASISAVGGRLRLEAVSSTSSSVRAGDNFTTEVGKVYRFVMGNTYIGTGATLPDFTVRTGHAIGSGGYLTPFTKVPGEYVFVATSTQAHIELFSGTDAIGEYSEFDNVSVREINPLAVSIQMDGLVTYADTNVSTQARLYGWVVDSNNYIVSRLYTTSGSGGWSFDQKALGVEDIVFTSGSVVSPGILQPYDIASRHGSTFLNGAVDGVALTADTTPVALPNLSATNLSLGNTYMGTIKTFRMWAEDLGNDGIAEASTNA